MDSGGTPAAVTVCTGLFGVVHTDHSLAIMHCTTCHIGLAMKTAVVTNLANKERKGDGNIISADQLQPAVFKRAQKSHNLENNAH